MQVQRLTERFELAQEQNDRRFEDLRWWVGWTVVMITAVIVLSVVSAVFR